jgi:hypothetical protein
MLLVSSFYTGELKVVVDIKVDGVFLEVLLAQKAL